MPTSTALMRNSIFAWIALATGVLLLIPLLAMQFTAEVNWDAFDFLVMGTLLFSAGSSFVLLARNLPGRYRWIAGVGVALAFVYVWAELAVGIFTQLGS